MVLFFKNKDPFYPWVDHPSGFTTGWRLNLPPWGTMAALKAGAGMADPTHPLGDPRHKKLPDLTIWSVSGIYINSLASPDPKFTLLRTALTSLVRAAVTLSFLGFVVPTNFARDINQIPTRLCRR